MASTKPADTPPALTQTVLGNKKQDPAGHEMRDPIETNQTRLSDLLNELLTD